jgi:monovalent cation/proton antiporter MnhG/PhaG subunit
VSAQDVAVDVLVAAGVAVELLCCIGVLVMRDALDRLHFAGPAATIGPAAIGAAVVVREGISQSGGKALLVAGILTAANPLIAHVTARAARIRERGRWQ